jgi:hypothetical protein
MRLLGQAVTTTAWLPSLTIDSGRFYKEAQANSEGGQHAQHLIIYPILNPEQKLQVIVSALRMTNRTRAKLDER